MDKDKEVKIQSDMFLLSLFAFTAHCIMFTIFLYNRIAIMAYFNAFSICHYLLLLFLFKRNPRPRTRVFGIISSFLEVSVHQILAIVCLGSDIGFQYFFLMLAVVIILQSKEVMGRKAKIASCIIIVFIMVLVTLYATIRYPVYILPGYIKQTMLVAITLVSTFGIITFTLNQWNISEHYRNQIENLLGEQTSKIFQMQEKVIRNFADIIEERDGSTGGHIKRTSAYVETIIQALIETGQYTDILTPDYVKMIISAAPLHDIGKISISDRILCKKGKLTTKEYDIMKTHSSIGASMLKELLGDLESEEYVNLATDISLYHHEKWNGMGYPEQISGDDIPLSARIMAVADVFDALTSERVYKEKFSLDIAYQIMESESGEQFDPILITEFIRIRPRITQIYTSLCG